ncbi:DNA polymerase III subunit gamma/tau [Synechococcus sp. R65.1]|uniref:DNA polymerase III subunit gamma/tau n=1 Tax=unclassified Synechococcus TaxID=2626047 RepID=UPI0039C2379B
MAAAGSYEPLHLKYRPQRFAEVVGQGAVVQTLANAIRLGRVAPAYLFCGPRGTGKTSSARILAKSLNCEQGPTPDPCQVCSQCRAITAGSSLDVVEIDAASNTGVDNIRELIERAQFAPVNSRYKVYVVDECHMLSNAAFNALLKTLEEPPPRVVFVLATTDPQRVLPTIVSRCQRFDFHRIPLEEMVAHLGKIAAQEGIPITPEALHLVAQLAQGGLRDAERLLDQLSLLEGSITPEAVWDLVGGIPEQQLLDLTDALLAQNVEGVLAQTRQLLERGKEPLVVLQSLAAFYRDLLLAKTAPQQRQLAAVTDPTWAALQQRAPCYSLEMLLAAQSHLRHCEPQIRQSGQPQLWLEIALLDLLGQLRQGAVPLPPIESKGGEPLSPADPFPPLSPGAVVGPSAAERNLDGKVAQAAPALEEPLASAGQSPQPAATAFQNPLSPSEGSPPPTPEPKVRDPEPVASPAKLLQPRWEEFLKGLSPTTRALLGSGQLQQETLVRLNGTETLEITLAFPSKGLVDKVRSKEAEVCSALYNLLQHPVRLKLVVQRPPRPREGHAGQASAQDKAPQPPLSPSKLGNSSPSSDPRQAEPSSPSPPLKNTAPAPQTARPPFYDLTHELVEVAHRFAEHFSGRLVDLEGILATPEEVAADLSALEGSSDLPTAESYGLPTAQAPPEEDF